MQNIWDKKSKTYPKFDGTLSEFQNNFFSFLNEIGVDFSKKSIIDVGAGTGIYTLELAKTASKILAIDTSKMMLNILKSSLTQFNYKNVLTFHGDINDLDFVNFDNIFEHFDKNNSHENEEFNSNKKPYFDIAFLTMSPALQSINEFKKFINLAKLRIYMNWDKRRYSNILEHFTSKFENIAPVTKKFENYLKKNGISYKSKILNETKIVKRSLNESYENILWHLEIQNIKIDKLTIKNKLKELSEDDFVLEKIRSSMKVLVF